MDIIGWICKNKEWFFSGIGITVITLIFRFVRKIILMERNDKNRKTEINQINNGVNNTQVGIQNNYYTREKENE